jgi:hypothetical protein
MSKVVEQVGIGAALIGASVLVPGGFLIAGTALSSILATAGAGMVLSGLGTLLGQKASGVATVNRNPISPWQISYGTTKVGGVVLYQEDVASNNRIQLFIIVLAAHKCNAITQIWFNNKALNFQINSQFADASNPRGFQQSFDPPQGNWQIETIARVNDVVTFTFAQNPNSHLSHFNGQRFHIHGTADAQGLASFDGYFPVVQLGDNIGSYSCGGAQGDGRVGTGTMTSTWPRYGHTVTAGYYLGDQVSASGMITGNSDYWTDECVVQGHTYIALKMIYDKNYYPGLPEFSFVLSGKSDIYDPRTKTRGYTANAALCIADYLTNQVFGFKAFYDTDPNPTPGAPIVPTAELIAAANICDEQVPLALGGSEPRYECNGAFSVDVKPGEVLQNMLTSCGGRFLELGGKWYIQPAAWVSPIGAVAVGGCAGAPKMMMSSDGLVPEFFNSPVATYVPACAGTSKSQFIYALGMLQAAAATGNSNALTLAKMALAPIVDVLFRGMQPPDTVTANDIWSPNWAFDVKQPFAGKGGVTISPTQDFASDFATPAGWRAMQGAEIQTNGDAYNWAIRVFALAASVIDNAYSTAAPDPGYGLSPYGASYGDPPSTKVTINSQYLVMLNAILRMASIAYQIKFTSLSGNVLTLLTPDYSGSGVPFAVEFLGSPAPKLSTWIGPYYTGYQSPYAIRQANPTNPAKVAAAVLFLSQAQNQLTIEQTVADTVVFTITGANPRTVSVPVQILVSGTVNAAFEYAGLNVGTDTIVATLPSHGLTSNAAKIQWSAYNKSIAVYGTQIQIMAADGSGFFNGASALVGGPQSVQGLMFNSHPQSIFPGDPHQSGNQANPFVSNITDITGRYAGDQPITGTRQPFNAVITGGFTVNAASTITFSAYVNSRFVIGVQGATYVSGPQLFGPLSGGTATKGYTPLAGNNAGAWPGGNWQQVNFSLHFPAPGLYAFEINFSSGLFGEREFALLAFGIPIPTINIAAGTGATATGTPPSGQIQLTPYSGGAAIGSNAVYFLAITGLTFTGSSAGPFAPIYYYQQPAGAQQWGVPQTWGFNGPDPNATSGYYQYRPLVELCDLIAICDGTESYYASANTVANTFIAWIAGRWTSFSAGPPNYFPQTGAQTTAPDIHCAALILHAALALDLHLRPNGTGTINASTLTCINEAYGMCITYYLSSGPMAGTFCMDAGGAQTWSPIWHGELLRSLSMLVQWCTVNGSAQDTVKANAITWINGLVDFSLNNVVYVNQDLGYTTNDLAGTVRWNPKLSKNALFNGIKGTFISEANQWQQADVPSYAQDAIHGYTNGTQAHNYDANWDADGARLWKDVQLPFTTSVSMAQRLFKIELMRIRQQGHGTVPGMMSMYKSAPLDIDYFSFPYLKWLNKLMEIAAVRLVQTKSPDGIPVLSVEVDFQETGPSVYEWDVSEELNPQGYSYISGLANLPPD